MNKDKGYAEEVTLKEFAPNIRQLVGRRLLKRGIPQTTNTITSYDVLNQTPFEASISVEIGKKKETSQESTEDYRWIPNTGEYLEIQDITIKGINNVGLPIGKDGSYIVLKGAKDRGYDKSKTNTGNIYVNEANKFEVVISTQSTELEKGYLSRSSKESSYYTYRSSGTVENELEIGNRNILSYKGETVVIKIRPISPEESYGGDDLLLEFELKNKTGSLYTLECLESDYIAVYDKKMLWRANLYIDETTTTEGDTPKLDWNNAHPWNAPTSKGATANAPTWWSSDWGYNDWNTSETIPGGQINIESWTSFQDNAMVTNSVAYGWGAWDGVPEFNNELQEQKKAIKAYREAEKAKKTANKEHDADYISTQWVENQTTAPGGDWNNYLFNERSSKVGENVITKRFATVSVPALSTYWDKKDLFEAGKHEHDTSGIDCSGLVHLAAIYQNHKYELPNKASDTAGKTVSTSGFASDTYSRIIRDGSWKLESPDKEDVAQKLADQKILSYAVPGDILIVSDDEKGRHVVFIQDIKHTEENGSILVKNFSDVQVIHSTEYLKDEDLNPTYQVRKSNCDEIQRNVSVYALRRLK